MRHRLGGDLLAVAALLLTGCDSVTGPADVSEPAIQTDGNAFNLSPSGDRLWADIPYTFTNRTGGAVYIVNCLGGFNLRLERKVGRQWVSAWSPLLLLCLSAPIVIGAGETYRNSVQPRLADGEPTGIYRIVWVDAFSSYQDRPPWGEQIDLEHRVSNEFQLLVE
jgi:hypothetical protein